MDQNPVDEEANQPPPVLEQMLIDEPNMATTGAFGRKSEESEETSKKDDPQMEEAIQYLPNALKELHIEDGRERWVVEKREVEKMESSDLFKASAFPGMLNIGAGTSANVEGKVMMMGGKEARVKETGPFGAVVMENIKRVNRGEVRRFKSFAPAFGTKERDIVEFVKKERRIEGRAESPVLQVIGGAEKEMEEDSKKIEPYNFVEIRSENQFHDRSKKSLHSVYYFYRNKVVQCPILDKHMNELDPKRVNTKFYKIDAIKSRNLCTKLHVRFLPFILLFKNGFIYDKIAGFYELNSLEEFFSEKMHWHSFKESLKVSEKHPRSHSSGNPVSKRPRIGLDEDPMVNIRSHHSAESDSDE